ncbi:IS3 family transposase [Streptosporangium sp. NPDC002607]
MAAEGLPVQMCCRVMGVSESGFYAWRNRPPSARALRHAWLTDMIRQVHAASHGVYGGRRVHAELVLGRGILVGHGAVELLMRRAGLKGMPGNRRRRPLPQVPTAADLVDRQFTRSAPNRLWVTDITEHPTREGTVFGEMWAANSDYILDHAARLRAAVKDLALGDNIISQWCHGVEELKESLPALFVEASPPMVDDWVFGHFGELLDAHDSDEPPGQGE